MVALDTGAVLMASRGRGATRLRQAMACSRKERHETEDDARRTMRRVIAEGDAAPGSLMIYTCRVCKGYHVGHAPARRRADT
jgi:hypothetical protein